MARPNASVTTRFLAGVFRVQLAVSYSRQESWWIGMPVAIMLRWAKLKFINGIDRRGLALRATWDVG